MPRQQSLQVGALEPAAAAVCAGIGIVSLSFAVIFFLINPAPFRLFSSEEALSLFISDLRYFTLCHCMLRC